ncbi:MAG: aldehyde ferredoxin oxidoreductase family protein [Candidatus Helarchaeota archaeon]
MLGLNGKIARINLTTKDIAIEELDEEIVKKYIGGLGIAMRYLYDEVPPEVEPLAPENKLIFMIGPLTSLISSTTRHVIVAKSPLSGILGESYSGGYWSYELRKAGYDGLIIEGKASSPVYIQINNDKIEIKDATWIWNLDAMETQMKLKQELGDDVRVASIGQAGINLVKYACIMNERDAAGRCGLGAVMGSKNLKAIVVRGSNDIKELAKNPDQLKAFAKEAISKVSDNLLVKMALGPGGTNGNYDTINTMGDVPHGYWKVGLWSGDKKLKGRVWKKSIVKHESCYLCPVNCKKVVESKDKETGEILFQGHGPEYETVSGFGPLLLNDDFVTIFKANELCNKYGLDTISCSETIGFAMECWEKGIIAKEAAEGLNLEWGDKEAILKLIEKIALREGIGDILAEGVDKAAEQLGKNSSDFAVTSKGVEVPHHDPRAFHSMALTYATSTHGANHCEGLTIMLSSFPSPELGFNEPIPRHSNDPEINARAAIAIQNLTAVHNALITCVLVASAFPLEVLLGSFKAITGRDITKEEFLKVGERIFNLKRMFNVRLGISKKDDTLPKRLMEPLPDGGAAGVTPDIEAFLPAYYKARGWTAEGIPTDETLKRLDLIVD